MINKYCFLALLLFLDIQLILANDYDKSKPLEIIKPHSDLNFDKIKPDLTVEFRNSGVGFIKRPRIIGFNFGLKIHARNRIGFGFYTLTHTAKKQVGLQTNGEDISQTSGQYDQIPTVQPIRECFFYYGNFAYSHYFVQNTYFEVQFPLEIGFGSYTVKYVDANNAAFPLINPNAPLEDQSTAAAFIENPKFLNRESTFLPISLSVTASVKLHTFVWPYFNLGYRFVVNAPEFSQDFNGLFYNFGLSFDFYCIGKSALVFIKKSKKVNTTL